MSMVTALMMEIWDTFFAMAPYLLLGLTFAGMLHVLFSKEFIVRHLGRDSFGSVVKAALLGVPLPLCSCGVVPTALSLRKSRASKGAVMSFLISTPQTGVDSIAATYGMLGPVFAVFRPLAALLMGIVGGAVEMVLGRREAGGDSCAAKGFECVICGAPDAHAHSVGERVRSMVAYGYGSFLDDISAQLVVGIVISGLIGFFIPNDFFVKYINNDFAGMLIMIAVGIPMYVCATASIPIAMALMMKGVSPGVAFVFLCVGPATNAATVLLISTALGKRFTVVYLAVMSLGAMAMGYALNFFVGVFGSGMPAMDHLHGHSMAEGSLVTWVWVVFFSAILALSLVRKWLPGVWARLVNPLRRAPAGGVAAGRQAIGVQGMTCSHCAAHVRDAMLGVPGVTAAHVDLSGKSATFDGSASVADVKAAIVKAGYRAA
jgi:uncharacterized protein